MGQGSRTRGTVVLSTVPEAAPAGRTAPPDSLPSRVQYQLLGPLEIRFGDQVVALGGSRERAALAMLLLEVNQVLPVERLIDAVWDDDPPATARGQIQICISSLRRRIAALGGGDSIVTRSPGYLLAAPKGAVDVQQFESVVAHGRELRERGAVREAGQVLREALSLWRGPALANVGSRLVRPGANRLNERRLVVLGNALDCELRAGEHHDAVAELGELVHQHPLREQFRGLLMTALFRAGRKAEALETYRRTREMLMDELGIEPGDELRRLHGTILASDADYDETRPRREAVTSPVPQFTPSEPSVDETAVDPAAVDPATVDPAAATASVDDAVGAAEPAAPGPSGADEPRRPSLLPASIPDFTGRSPAVEQLTRTLVDASQAGDGVVAVGVIVGQGGAGKTTLALHVAHLLAPHFPDGQLFARLRVGDRPARPADILERFLRALGVAGTALPDGIEERAELFRDLVGGRRMLVVLDDVMSEQQAAALLPGTSECAVLITSRGRLAGLPAVTRTEIGSLSPASAAELIGRIAGAERIAAEPEAVAELCELCANLPLALRIVGARLAARRHWSVADLVDRLVDESRRLDELHYGEMGVRASITLTYDGLSAEARTLFRRLALLETSSIASWVAAPLLQLDPRQAQDLLDELADAYLVDTEARVDSGPARYRLHDIMRSFALERLAAEDSADDRRAGLERWLGALLSLSAEAHRREYAGDFAQQANTASRYPLPDRLVDRLLADPLAWFEAERTSLVAAIRQAAAAGLAGHAWGLALTSVTLFESRVYLSDWALTHDVALEAAVRAGDRRGEAAMRYSAGSLHMFEQRFDAARTQLERALELSTELSDRHGVALAQRNLAFLDRLAGDLESSLTRGTDALRTLRAVGDHIAEAHVLHNLAEVHMQFDELDKAHQALERAAHICEQLGNRRVGAQVQHRLGALLARRGDLSGATAAYRRALDAVRASRDKIGECYVLLGLAGVELELGDAETAQRSLTTALELALTTGERIAESRILLTLAETLLALGSPDAAVEHADRAHRGFVALHTEMWRVRALTVGGRARLAAGDPDGAVASWRSARELATMLKLDPTLDVAVEIDLHLAAASTDLAATPPAPTLVPHGIVEHRTA